MRYVFHTTLFLPTPNPARFRCVALEAYAKTVDEAWQLVHQNVPEGYRVWTWHEEPWACCSVCGPFSPVTGYQPREGGRWCGPCARGAVEMILALPKRKATSWEREGRHPRKKALRIPFYQHARPPPNTNTVGD